MKSPHVGRAIRVPLLMLAAALPLVPLYAQAQTARHPPEMAEMARVFRMRTRELSAQYESAIKALPPQYQRDIQALHDLFRNKGDLDGVLATDREMKRFAAAFEGERDPFELTPEMPPEAIVAAPAELRQLQEQYVARFKDAAALRLREIRDLAGKYLAALQKIQGDLTRAGRIQDAIIVKQESERLQKGIEEDGLVQLAEQMAIELLPVGNGGAAETSASNAPPAQVPVYGSVPNWARWKFAGSGRFARERTQYAHPDLPDELDDEHRAHAAQPLDDVAVVDHFVPHVDRCAEQRDRALDDLDRAIHPGAEAAGGRNEDLQAG